MMPLTPEQQDEIRSQLREQVAQLPDEKKAQAYKQIEALSPEALEELVKQSEERETTAEEGQGSIFRKIVTGKIPSQVIADLPEGVAVLDINPVSPGHTLLIPRTAITKATKMPTALFKRAKQIGLTITKNLKASSIELATQELFGEAVIHIIPSYKEKKTLLSQRTKATEQELKHIQTKIAFSPRKRTKKVLLAPTSTHLQHILLKRRIP
ncbi:HIT family protein [Candidatus Pacearchaeota archaeon]|nr:HIT family protein [Candidatus Pacearchaeota archaeon]